MNGGFAYSARNLYSYAISPDTIQIQRSLTVMLTLFSYFVSAVILISLCLAVFYSYRYRRLTHEVQRGIYAAKMNIAMGFMLVFMAILQIFLFEANTIRTVLGTIFLLLGLFNFFSGVRNHIHYSSRKQ
jgi:hypothetical protein